MKKSIIFAGVCILLLVAGSAFAQGTPSAKFAASWNDEAGIESVVNIPYESLGDSGSEFFVNPDTGYTLATLKVPNKKELLVGVSAEIGIVTDTSVRGKNGGAAKAIAGGQAYVNIFAVPKGTDVDVNNSIKAEPGQIMLSKRVQELSATLGGVIQSCTLPCGYGDNPATPEVETDYFSCEEMVIARDCLVTDEELGLLLDTTAAHHFNFVFPNLPVGTWDIVAVFTTGARAQVDICDDGDDWCGTNYDPEGEADGSSYAKAIINKTMVTVQEVRAVKGSLLQID